MPPPPFRPWTLHKIKETWNGPTISNPRDAYALAFMPGDSVRYLYSYEEFDRFVHEHAHINDIRYFIREIL